MTQNETSKTCNYLSAVFGKVGGNRTKLYEFCVQYSYDYDNEQSLDVMSVNDKYKTWTKTDIRKDSGRVKTLQQIHNTEWHRQADRDGNSKQRTCHGRCTAMVSKCK